MMCRNPVWECEGESVVSLTLHRGQTTCAQRFKATQWRDKRPGRRHGFAHCNHLVDRNWVQQTQFYWQNRLLIDEPSGGRAAVFLRGFFCIMQCILHEGLCAGRILWLACCFQGSFNDEVNFRNVMQVSGRLLRPPAASPPLCRQEGFQAENCG